MDADDADKAAHNHKAKQIAKAFGQKVQRVRGTRGFTQGTLAQAADLDRSYVGRIERGQVNLTIEKVYRLAEVLNCRVLDLLP